jgi:hypothetical protein
MEVQCVFCEIYNDSLGAFKKLRKYDLNFLMSPPARPQETQKDVFS